MYKTVSAPAPRPLLNDTNNSNEVRIYMVHSVTSHTYLNLERNIKVDIGDLPNLKRFFQGAVLPGAQAQIHPE